MKKIKIIITVALIITTLLITTSCSKASNKEENNNDKNKKLFYAIMTENQNKTDNFTCVGEVSASISPATIKENIIVQDTKNFIRGYEGIEDNKYYVKNGKILEPKDAFNLPTALSEDAEYSKLEITLISNIKKEYLEPIITEFQQEKIMTNEKEQEAIIGKATLTKDDLDYIPAAWYASNLSKLDDFKAEVTIAYNIKNKELIMQEVKGTFNNNGKTETFSYTLTYSNIGKTIAEFPIDEIPKYDYNVNEEFTDTGRTNAKGRKILKELDKLTYKTNRVIEPLIVNDVLYGGFSQGVFYPVGESEIDPFSDFDATDTSNFVRKGDVLKGYFKGQQIGEYKLIGETVETNDMDGYSVVALKTDPQIDISKDAVYTKLLNPYPLAVTYSGNNITVDLDNNGEKDTIYLKPMGENDYTSKYNDLEISLNGTMKKIYTTKEKNFDDGPKIIFIDVIDIDNDGLMEILGVEIQPDTSFYANVILKYENGEIVKKYLDKKML